MRYLLPISRSPVARELSMTLFHSQSIIYKPLIRPPVSRCTSLSPSSTHSNPIPSSPTFVTAPVRHSTSLTKTCSPTFFPGFALSHSRKNSRIGREIHRRGRREPSNQPR